MLQFYQNLIDQPYQPPAYLQEGNEKVLDGLTFVNGTMVDVTLDWRQKIRQESTKSFNDEKAQIEKIIRSDETKAKVAFAVSAIFSLIAIGGAAVGLVMLSSPLLITIPACVALLIIGSFVTGRAHLYYKDTAHFRKLFYLQTLQQRINQRYFPEKENAFEFAAREIIPNCILNSNEQTNNQSHDKGIARREYTKIFIDQLFIKQQKLLKNEKIREICYSITIMTAVVAAFVLAVYGGLALDLLILGIIFIGIGALRTCDFLKTLFDRSRKKYSICLDSSNNFSVMKFHAMAQFVDSFPPRNTLKNEIAPFLGQILPKGVNEIIYDYDTLTDQFFSEDSYYTEGSDAIIRVLKNEHPLLEITELEKHNFRKEHVKKYERLHAKNHYQQNIYNYLINLAHIVSIAAFYALGIFVGFSGHFLFPALLFGIVFFTIRVGFFRAYDYSSLNSNLNQRLNYQFVLDRIKNMPVDNRWDEITRKIVGTLLTGYRHNGNHLVPYKEATFENLQWVMRNITRFENEKISYHYKTELIRFAKVAIGTALLALPTLAVYLALIPGIHIMLVIGAIVAAAIGIYHLGKFIFSKIDNVVARREGILVRYHEEFILK